MKYLSDNIRRVYIVVSFATWIEDVMIQIDALRRRGVFHRTEQNRRR
jgi:hypothetical protein